MEIRVIIDTGDSKIPHYHFHLATDLPLATNLAVAKSLVQCQP